MIHNKSRDMDNMTDEERISFSSSWANRIGMITEHVHSNDWNEESDAVVFHRRKNRLSNLTNLFLI